MSEGGSATGGALSSGGSSGGGTGGTSGNGDTSLTGGAWSAPPDDACVAAVLAANACTVCHSVASAAAIGSGLVLEGTNLGARLSTTRATYKGVSKNAGSCVEGALIIDPESPADSVLLKKVTNTQACGDAMPQGTALKGSDLSCIRNWVNKF
jgi:hypothetical protein